MSEDTKVYAQALGMVQSFNKAGVRQPAVKTGEANGQHVYNVTIKTPNNNFVDIAVWSGTWGDTFAGVQEGYLVYAHGVVTQREYQNKVYTTVTPYHLVVVPCMARLERQVENAPAAAPVEQAAAPAAAAPAAAPVATGHTF